MHRFFIPQLYAQDMLIEGVDAKHIIKVLRMQPKEKLQIVSDDGITAIAEIKEIVDDKVIVWCLEKLSESHEPNVKITLAQGLAKGEKMDFIIQKAVELGVCAVVPVAMEHSVVRLDSMKAEKKIARWQKIAEAAAKQSKRDIIPVVQPVQTMTEMLKNNNLQYKIIAYECEDRLGLKTALQSMSDAREILLIIGPEGGISEHELNLAKEQNAIAVSLGKRILRAETAGIVAMSAILYQTGDLGE